MKFINFLFGKNKTIIDEQIPAEMKYLIVGLGNIGYEYTETRHNIGFKILDYYASEHNLTFEPKRYGDIALHRLKGRHLILLKPSTYMNLSGKAVRYWLEKEKIPVENMLVLVDDINLDLGVIRIRAKGSDGGHNGLKSICEVLGHCNYARLRFGIGNNFPRGHQADYVLGEWTEEEKQVIKERIPVAYEAIKSFVLMGLSRTMTNFNKK